MESEKFSILISPETLALDIYGFIYTADTGYSYEEQPRLNLAVPNQNFRTDSIYVYSGMSDILSGGTNGDSVLTGLTIPIMFTQTYNDIGFYSEFDGLLLQKDIVTNFLFSGTNLSNTYEVTLYNTSGDFTVSYLDFTSYSVDWGDGLSQPLTTPFLNHTYISSGDYTITLSGSNPWGVTIIEKTITIPLVPASVTNPQGTITFIPQQGNWANTPISYNYIFDGDAQNNIPYQISSNFTTVPFPISGYTKSRIQDLKRWGPAPYTVGYVFNKNNQVFGQVDSMTPDYTAYTINNVNYYDLVNGKTFYIVNSSGLTSNDIVASAMTKNEYLLDFVMSPEIQTDVYIERGKYSAFEPLQRLGEVDNIGDLVRYGYGYYRIKTT
jgi:hypothetical protein